MRLRHTTVVIALALVLVAGAGVATATIVIYNNNFSSRSEFKALGKFEGGKQCKKSYRGKKGFGVQVLRGPLQCDYRTPVSGDSKEPDHDIEASAAVLKSTAKSARSNAYVGVALRADKSSRYELRVFPETRAWEVRRRPDREGFPLEGTDPGIKRGGDTNKLKLRAFGDRITASVNKARVVDAVRDPNPGELNGRRTLLVGGHSGNSKGDVEALFKNVRIRLP